MAHVTQRQVNASVYLFCVLIRCEPSGGDLPILTLIVGNRIGCGNGSRSSQRRQSKFFYDRIFWGSHLQLQYLQRVILRRIYILYLYIPKPNNRIPQRILDDVPLSMSGLQIRFAQGSLASVYLRSSLGGPLQRRLA